VAYFFDSRLCKPRHIVHGTVLDKVAKNFTRVEVEEAKNKTT